MDKIVLFDGKVKRDLVLLKSISVTKKSIQLFVIDKHIVNAIQSSSIFTGGESVGS